MLWCQSIFFYLANGGPNLEKRAQRRGISKTCRIIQGRKNVKIDLTEHANLMMAPIPSATLKRDKSSKSQLHLQDWNTCVS